jgi:hypothetical protein
MPSSPSLARFVLRTFLWLAPCFALWYFAAPLQTAVVGVVARAMIDLMAPGVVSEVERAASALVFVTTLEVHPAAGQTALLVPEVNALIYTYGLALFAALMLAARAPAWKILVGGIALLPFQGWGIALDCLVQVAVKLGPDVAAQAHLLGWRREAIALGYQVGSLVFPSLVPVVVWAILCRGFIATLPGRRAH